MTAYMAALSTISAIDPSAVQHMSLRRCATDAERRISMTAAGRAVIGCRQRFCIIVRDIGRRPPLHEHLQHIHEKPPVCCRSWLIFRYDAVLVLLVPRSCLADPTGGRLRLSACAGRWPLPRMGEKGKEGILHDQKEGTECKNQGSAQSHVAAVRNSPCRPSLTSHPYLICCLFRQKQ
ncbi:hypothetical protein DOTSEDRAFT_69323 [Dothistroma septosporum NZE10]|uniref:Uncharacterized protein n=1 Tax=Dothistroma septosporum (strain NZE10 / CBS 128990) TaxID=675120 RepID=N1PV47_DOTSN|nr:hypothetical protein DOTSEDRAFT_69323 [Dothistroma septosporum NZE10]